MAIISAGGSA